MRLAQVALGWMLYLCSAAPFATFVAVAVMGDMRAEPARIIAVNALIFAASGVTAVIVKNAFFNAAMALAALPYAGFLLGHRASDPSGWSLNDVEGSVAYVSIYCLIGMASTAVWLLVRASAIWRLVRRAGLHDGRARPGRG